MYHFYLFSVFAILAAAHVQAAETQTDKQIFISSYVHSSGWRAVEIYNPSCTDVDMQSEKVKLEVLLCNPYDNYKADTDQNDVIGNSLQLGDCYFRDIDLPGTIPSLETFTLCSNAFGEDPGLGRRANNFHSMCNAIYDSFFNGPVVAKIVLKTNGTKIDELDDSKLLAGSPSMTLIKYSGNHYNYLQLNDYVNNTGEDEEVESVWIYKPYATFVFLGCHSTQQDYLCTKKMPQTCPKPDVDSVRTYRVTEINQCESSDNGSACKSALHGETISTLGYITGAVSLPGYGKSWMFVLQDGSGSNSALRIAIDFEEENNLSQAFGKEWLNTLAYGSKVSIVGRVNYDGHGIIMDEVFNIALLDNILSVQKIIHAAPSYLVAPSKKAHKIFKAIHRNSKNYCTLAVVSLGVFSLLSLVISAFLVLRAKAISKSMADIHINKNSNP